MSSGTYGIVRPADVSPDDVDIIFHYTPNRNATSSVTLKKLDSKTILTPVFHNSETTNDPNAPNLEVLGGLYNLKLESVDFSDIGIYTLHLRPRQIRTIITDCGVLAALPSVRGLVIDLSNITGEDRNKCVPQNLVGYRVEYLNPTDKKKVPNFYKIITSNFYCEPVVTNQTNTTQKSIRYKYSDTPTNLVFLTVTPSAAPTTKPNTAPFIGQPQQSIILTNTYFNPTTIEVEMVEYDMDTLGYALYGNQSKSVSSGIYSIYDNNNNIYKQYNLYEVKDQYNDTLYEIREKRTEIDQSLNFDTITQ